MTDAQETTVERDGVNVRQIVITSATPAVLESICKKITDDIMAQIPDKAIHDIASDVLKGGMIITGSRSSWGGQVTETWTLADRTKAMLKELLEGQVKNYLETLWSSPPVQRQIEVLVESAFVSAMSQLPRLVASHLVQRLSGFIATPGFAETTELQLAQTSMELHKLREAVERAGLPIDPKAPG